LKDVVGQLNWALSIASRLIISQYFTNGLGTGPHDVTLTGNPRQKGQQNTGKFMDLDEIVVFDAVTPNDHRSGSMPLVPAAALQSNQTHTYPS
jgi:hypothetical protein